MKFLVLIFFLFQSFYSYSNFEWNSNCNKAYKKILLLEFNTANQIILEEKKENPSNKIVYLLDNYIDFFKIQIGEEKADYIHNIKQIESRIEHISNGEKSSQWFNYSLAEIYIQTAANRLKFGDYFKAAYDINKAYRLLSSNKEKYPEFIPNNKSIAVLETLLGTIPEKYNWVLSLVNMNGSVKNGLNNLDKTIKNMKKNALYNYLIDESFFYYSFLKMNLQNDTTGLHSLITEIKDSPLQILNFASSRIASKVGKNDLAISILENRIQSTNSYPFYYLDFLVGKGKLNNLDLNAKDDFIYYLNHFKGENYIKSSYMYLSWLAIIEGDTNLFHNYQAKINSTGSSLVGSDKEAQNQFSNKVIPNVDLLKARLLYDGGYYNRSLQILKNISFPNNTDEKLEWVYRKAVNYEKLGMIDLAEEYFILSYKLGKSKPYYFAAKSAVHLAQIYEKRNNTASANEYFQKCIDLENHEYEQSLEQKAKAGLNRIKISNP
jgi:hypothetical protein